MRELIFVLVLALAAPALAQGQTLEQRIGGQIGALVIQIAGLQMQTEQLQAALKAAQDRVKVLEDKYEPAVKPSAAPEPPSQK